MDLREMERGGEESEGLRRARGGNGADGGLGMFSEQKWMEDGEMWRKEVGKDGRTEGRMGGGVERERGALIRPSVLNTSASSSPPLPCRLSSRTRGRNYVWRAHTSPPRRRPRPMRYVTGPSPPSPTVVIISLSSPFPPVTSPYVCPQRRTVQVSLTSARMRRRYCRR